MKTPTRSQLQRGMQRYLAGDRPWPERASAVDWFIASKKGELFPLKYTYSLAVDQRPSLYTTNQMKRRLKGLNLTFVSLKVSHSHDEDFQRAVSASLGDLRGRKKRLKAASPKPTQRALVLNVFLRNADVVAEVLDRVVVTARNAVSRRLFLGLRTNGHTWKYITRSHWLPGATILLRMQ